MKTKLQKTIERVNREAQESSYPDIYKAAAFQQLFEDATYHIEQLTKL